VDQGYREEFRDLFEAHFGRFEARLEQATAELRAEFRTELHSEIAGVRAELSRMEARLIRWMFVFWIGAWVTIAGTIVALRRLV
jgi:hypothetical protein